MLSYFMETAKSYVTKPIYELCWSVGDYIPLSKETITSVEHLKANDTIRVEFANCPTVYAKCVDYYQKQTFDFPQIQDCPTFSIRCGPNCIIGEEWDFNKPFSVAQEFYQSSLTPQVNSTLSVLPSYEQLGEKISGLSSYISNLFAGQSEVLEEAIEEFKPCHWDNFTGHYEALKEPLLNCSSNITCHFDTLYNYALQYDFQEILAEFKENYLASQEDAIPYVAVSAAVGLVGLGVGLYMLWNSKGNYKKGADTDDKYSKESQEILKAMGL